MQLSQQIFHFHTLQIQAKHESYLFITHPFPSTSALHRNTSAFLEVLNFYPFLYLTSPFQLDPYMHTNMLKSLQLNKKYI